MPIAEQIQELEAELKYSILSRGERAVFLRQLAKLRDKQAKFEAEFARIVEDVKVKLQ
jgi:hypothetical protein